VASSKKRDFRSTCLWWTLVIGMGCIGWGSVVPAVLPCDTIQIALTPEEQADESFRMRIREILKEAASYEAFNWVVAGAALIALSGFGLWTAPPRRAGLEAPVVATAFDSRSDEDLAPREARIRGS
jgi:hypothetical protein